MLGIGVAYAFRWWRVPVRLWHVRARRSLVACLVVLGIACSGMHDARSQNITDVDNLTNFAFLHYYGTGAFTVGEQRVLVFRIPPAITLRSMEDYPWGLRLKLAFGFAIQDFETPEDLNLDSYRVFTLVPGIEFLFPVGRTQTLRPYLDLGLGVDDESNQLALVGGIGLRTEFIHRWHKFRLGFEPRALFSGSRSLEGPKTDDSYFEIVIGGGARHPTWFTIGQAQPDVGVYGEISQLFNTLEFESVSGEPISIRNLFEIGIILGFQYPRPKLWLFTVPSMSIGYRFGKDFKGLRIAFGGDWTTPIPVR